MSQLVAVQSLATGLINRLKNGDFALNNGTLSRTDGQEAYPSWNVLTQTGAVSCSVVSNPEATQIQCARVTQSQSTPQRYGLIQWIPNSDCGDLRTLMVSLSGQLRYSLDQNVRFAVLGFTGTADTQPTDVVANWTSALYVPGQFFSSLVTVVSVGTFHAQQQAEWWSLPYIPLQVGSTNNNLAVFIWTENAVAQGTTLDFGAIQLCEGTTPLEYEHRPLVLQELLAGTATPTAPYLVADIATLQAQVWSATSAPREVTLIKNYYANDATGLDNFHYDATDTTTADDGALTIVTASGLRFKRNWDKRNMDARWWGVIANGTTPCAALINSAMAALYAVGGGNLILPSGAIRCETTVDNQYDRVMVQGAGRVAWTDGGLTWTYGAELFAVFAGTLAKVRSPYGATNSKKRGSGFNGVYLNGNQLSTIVLEYDSASLNSGWVYATGCVGTYCIHFKNGVTGTNLAEACDIQDSDLTLFVRQIDTVAEQSVHCVQFDGSSNANTNNNSIRIVAEHKNGDACRVMSGDQNAINVRAQRAAGGSGKLFYAGGPTASVPVGCERNSLKLAGGGATYAEGTGDPGVVAGIWNSAEIDYLNGTPTPTAGTGSYWALDGQQGDLSNYSMVAAVIADTRAAAIAQRANVAGESLLIYNAAERHLVLRDAAANAWSIRIVNSSGDLEMVRLAGSGKLNLPAITGITISGAQLSYGANDSGGAGFKLLRVPN